jgi:hypothetical protein
MAPRRKTSGSDEVEQAWDEVEQAWRIAQRLALLAAEAKTRDEQLVFLKLYSSWEKTAVELQLIQRERLKKERNPAE